MTVVVLCCTRNRPAAAVRLYKSMLATSRASCLFYVDHDDVSDYGNLPIFRGPRCGNVRSFSLLLAEVPRSDLIIGVDDEVIAKTPRWDDIVLSRVNPDEPWLLTFNNGSVKTPAKSFAQGFTRGWHANLGIYPSMYYHQKADVHVKELANKLGRHMFFDDVVFFRELKPKSNTDATHIESLRDIANARKMYFSINFDDEARRVGKILGLRND